MFEIIRSEYGREIKAFEFDYLGEHKGLEGIILNAEVKIYENGLYIGTRLSRDYAYFKWNEIIKIYYIFGKKEKLKIEYTEGMILLEKAKKEISINEFLTSINEAAPNAEILKIECDQDEECDYELQEDRLREIDEQDKRIEKILRDVDEDDKIEMMETWAKYLKDVLMFPFEGEIVEPQEGGSLKLGNRLTVIKIEDFDDLYGIIVGVTYKKRRYSFPLCDLEAVDRNSENFIPVDDYSMWFANR